MAKLANDLGASPSADADCLTYCVAVQLWNNALTHLPADLGQCRQLQRINVANNPLRNPPFSVCNRGGQAVVAYMRAAEHKQPRPNDVLLVVGHGGCGKTTFTRTMAHEDKDFRSIVEHTKQLVEEWEFDQLKTWILELMMIEAGIDGVEAATIVNVDDPATVLPPTNAMTKRMIDMMKGGWWNGDPVDGDDWLDEDQQDNWKTLQKELKKKKFKKVIYSLKKKLSHHSFFQRLLTK